MTHRTRLEMLVGFFVVLALVILTFMVFFISGVYIFKQGYHINVLFNFVSTLEKGASVRLSGIPVGSVSSLEIQYDEKTGRPLVKAELFINKGIVIYENARIKVEGIYGLSTPHLEIKTGGDPLAKPLRDGSTLIGMDPVPIDDLVAKGQQIVEDLQETIVRVNHFIADPEVGNSLRGTLIHLNALTETMTVILRDKQGNVTETINQIEAASSHLKSILEKIDKGEGTAGKLLSDEALYREIEEFVKDLKRHPWKLLKKGDDEGKGRRRVLGIF